MGPAWRRLPPNPGVLSLRGMSLAWLSAALPAADLQSSLDSFFNAVEAFFSNLAAVQWGALVLALLLYLCHQLCRSRAWFNVLRAAYPNERFRWRRIAGAQVAGMGINSVLPARAGDVTKIYLAKQSIPASSYPAVTSSFFVDSVFDIPVGLLVLFYAIAAGGLPSLNLLPSLPAFDLAFWAEHPRFLLFTSTAITIGLLVLFAVFSVRAVVFWRRIKQGVVILTDFRRYLRQVASWMTVGWSLRFAAFWFSLEAFNIGGSAQNVLFMMGVQAVSTLTPFTPGGAGAQQALMVYAFRDVASRSTVLAYSVGQQIAMAAFNFLCALVAIFLIARTLSIRSLIRRGEEERREAEQPEEATVEPAATEWP
jgi:glycosyltransferase 2 family protein